MFENETARHAMRQRAYNFGRQMVWPEVARQYLRLFAEVGSGRSRAPKPPSAFVSPQYRFEGLPELAPKHLIALTDSTGILQHARFSVPDLQYGYSTDDQARAVVVAVRGSKLRPDIADWD